MARGNDETTPLAVMKNETVCEPQLRKDMAWFLVYFINNKSKPTIAVLANQCVFFSVSG